MRNFVAVNLVTHLLMLHNKLDVMDPQHCDTVTMLGIRMSTTPISKIISLITVCFVRQILGMHSICHKSVGNTNENLH